MIVRCTLSQGMLPSLKDILPLYVPPSQPQVVDCVAEVFPVVVAACTEHNVGAVDEGDLVPSVCPSLSVFRSLSMSVCPSLSVFRSLSVRLSFSLCLSFSLSLSVCLSFFLSLCSLARAHLDAVVADW